LISQFHLDSPVEISLWAGLNRFPLDTGGGKAIIKARRFIEKHPAAVFISQPGIQGTDVL
jgi:hypothetical protein